MTVDSIAGLTGTVTATQVSAALRGTVANTLAAGDDARLVGAQNASQVNNSISTALAPYATTTSTGKLYFANYRAVAPDDQTAMNNLLAAWNGEVIMLGTPGILLSTLTINVPSNKAMVMRGNGSGSTVLLVTGAGITINLAANAHFEMTGVTFQRGSISQATWSGTALTVTASHAGLPCGVRLRDLSFTGGPTFFQTGIALNDCQFPELRTIRWYSNSGDPASATFDGTAIHIHGSNPASGIFAVDADIIGLTVSGGYAGVRMSGGVQGVYMTNFRIIGSVYGVYWPGVGADIAELLTCSQGHTNTTRAGIYAAAVSWVQLNNILCLHNAPDTGGWCAVDLPESFLVTISNLVIYGLGGGTTSPETGIRYSNTGAGGAQPSSISNCTIAAVNGLGVSLLGLVSDTIVSGCNLNGTAGVGATTAGNTIGPNKINGAFSGTFDTLNVASSIEVGSLIASGPAYMDMHSSGTGNDYDVRLIASGGASAPGQGTLDIAASVVRTPDINIAGSGGMAGSWTSVSAPVTSGGGNFGSGAAATVRYKKFGRIVYFNVKALIPHVGTASGNVQVTLPFTSAISSGCAGREGSTTGRGLSGITVDGGNILYITECNGNFPAPVDGATLVLNGTYEATA